MPPVTRSKTKQQEKDVHQDSSEVKVGSDNKRQAYVSRFKEAIDASRRWLYDLWAFLCLYTLGLYYMPIEVNRKLNWFSGLPWFSVRKLKPSDDLPHDLSKLSVIMTGGSRGIGWEAAKMLLLRGARVIIASSVKDGIQMKELKDHLVKQLEESCESSVVPDNLTDNLECWHLDLSSFSSVISFVQKFTSSERHLNVLINNAGQMYSPFRVTKDNLESHWEINYLSHSLLIALLLPVLEETGRKCDIKSRIINVASSTHYARDLNLSDVNGFQLYSPYHAYAQSKLAQIMFTYKLHELLSHHPNISHVSVNCLHPGVAKTELYENVWWVKTFPFLADILFRTAKEGAETVVFAAVSQEMEGIGGKYLEDMKMVSSSSYSYRKGEQDALWRQTVGSIRSWIDLFISSSHSSQITTTDSQLAQDCYDIFSL